ncbi:MAG: dockerin type I repeat-containing protein [Ruminococcus sp.]|nr:dockerin type I repeat-containing protein [Ruminococcus sp.]
MYNRHVLQEIINNQSHIFEQIAYHISGIYNEEGQHQNATYTLMGGIAVNSETYAIVGKSERFYASNHYAEYRTGIYDVFVRIVARDPEDSLPLAGVDRVDELTGNVADKNVIWLTECDDVTKAGSVKVVSLRGNRYCVLWETFKNNSFDHISYVIIDQYGNQLQNETSIFNARLSDTSIQPIVQDEILTWAVADKYDGIINWYTVDLNQKITASSRIIGDINLDGAVTVSDAVILQKYLLCSCTLKEEQCEAADLMEDGNINIFDLAVLKCILLQSTEKLKGI